MMSLCGRNMAAGAMTVPCCKSKMIRGQANSKDSKSITCSIITLIN